MLRTLLRTLALLTVVVTASAQEGKPLYAIDVFRSDTTLGRITIELFPDIAPLHVRNFDSLVSIGFFDSTAFHRVIPGFVIQGGDPNTRSGPKETWGIGDPSQTNVPAEFNPISHQRGILSAARASDPNSATSQFFIVVAPATSLDGRYTVYGRVTSGMDVVDSIVSAPTEVNQFNEKSRPIDKIIMIVTRIGTDTTRPDAPALVSPADDTTRVRAVQPVRWTAVEGAILYEVQASRTPDFATVEFRDSVVGTTASLRGLELGQQRYYWRVRASNGGRRGEFSEVRSFTTTIAKPVLLSPPNTSLDVPKPVVLRWSSVPGATSYRAQGATSIGFTTLLFDREGLTDTTVTVEGLPASQRVIWRVFAYDGSGDSSESSRATFTTDAVAGVEVEASAVSLRVEGAGDDLRVRLTQRRNDATLEIVGARGDVVRRWTELPVGMTVVPLETAGLPAGVYLARLVDGDTVATARFVIVR